MGAEGCENDVFSKERILHVKISGNSMYPVISNGDVVIVKSKIKYIPGDIIVFIYKGSLLVHRLIKIENGRYFCKGDNSFRLEDIEPSQIIGFVILDSDPHRNDTFIKHSYEIDRLFRANGYNHAKTMISKEYQKYKDNYLS